MQNKLETITPKKAAEWLTHNTNNRPMKNAFVERLTAAILNGEWRVNADAIRFNCDGTLIDGQNRLTAIVRSNKTVQSYVARGLESDAFDTIDQGSPRTAGDILARRGEKFYNNTASAVRTAWHLMTTGGIHSSVQYRAALAVEFLEQNPGIRDSVALMQELQIWQLTQVGIASAIHYIAHIKSPQKADEFFTAVATGEKLTKQMPAYVLRQRLVKNRGDVAKLPREHMAAFIIKAWNAEKAGKTLGTLKWVDTEEFPTIN